MTTTPLQAPDVYHLPLRLPVRVDPGFVLANISELAWEDTTSIGSLIEWFVPRPLTGTISSLIIISQGSGHVGVPAKMPRVDLYRYDPLTSAAVTVAFASDLSTLAGIDSRHAWGITGMSEQIQPARFYAMRIAGESGIHSTMGHRYHDAYFEIAP